MALFPHSLYFIIHTVLDKENNRKSNRLPLGQRICFRTQLYGYMEIFPISLDTYLFLKISLKKSI